MANLGAVGDIGSLILRSSLSDDRFGRMTVMKLLKLTYVAKGIGFARLGRAIYGDDIEAWDRGPVVVDLWKHLRGKHYLTASDVKGLGDPDAVPDDVKQVISETLSEYGAISGDALSALSHVEPPWLEARARGANAALTDDSMAAYFCEVVGVSEQRDIDADIAALSRALG